MKYSQGNTVLTGLVLSVLAALMLFGSFGLSTPLTTTAGVMFFATIVTGARLTLAVLVVWFMVAGLNADEDTTDEMNRAWQKKQDDRVQKKQRQTKISQLTLTHDQTVVTDVVKLSAKWKDKVEQ